MKTKTNRAASLLKTALTALPLVALLSLAAPTQAEPIRFSVGGYHFILSENPVAQMVADCGVPDPDSHESDFGHGNGNPHHPEIGNFHPPVSAVPEPGTLALLGLGILGMLMIRSRERRHAGKR